MKVIGIVAFVLVATLAVSAFPQAADTTLSQSLIQMARDLVTNMAGGDFSAATADFDSTMSAAMPSEKLAEAWGTITAQVGQFRNQRETRQEKVAAYDVIFVTCDFEKSPLDVKVVFDKAGRVAGLFFAPVTSTVKFESPPYAIPKSFRKTDVTIGSGEWSLPGTLTMPWGRQLVPAVVLVHGSGPNDRDETIGPNKPFRDLAEGLASKGIAVLRYDKRTLKYGEKIISIIDSLTVKEETVDDAVAAAELLRQTPGIDTSRIFILGHSLGGMLIPRIANAGSAIAGFIIMAGTTRPLEDVLLEQYTYIFSLDGTMSKEEQAEIDKLKTQIAAVKSASLSPATKSSDLPLNLPAKYWLDLRGYDPAESAKEIKQPILIIQGGRDYQVTMADYEGWQKALSGRPDVQFKLYPALNHLFISGDGKSTPQEYEKAGHVDGAVIDDIANWIKGN